jgi:SNF2 family DNA or RNA helicase
MERNKMKLVLHDYQKRLLQHMIRDGIRMLFLKMGMGKTPLTLAYIKYYIDKGMFKKILIIAPLRVAETTWIDECKKWDQFKDLKVVSCCGSAKERIEAFKSEADIYCINRESCVWMVQNVDLSGFDLLVIDELSSFKCVGRTEMINKHGKKVSYFGSKRFIAISQVRHLFKHVIGLTGTPMANSYLELFPETYLIDGGTTLGSNFYQYRNKYFKEGYFNTWEIKKGSESKILNKMDRIAVSLKPEDYLKMPDLVHNDIWLKPDQDFLDRYQGMKKFWIDNMTGIETENVITKLLQMASGFLYDDEKKIYWVHDMMIDALEEIVEIAGDNILVFVNFRAEIDRIQKRFKDARMLISPQDLKDWNDRKIKIAVSHPASTGHGLNIQLGGHTIVWYGLNWSSELTLQAEGRLYRQGQPSDKVIIHRLMVGGTIHKHVKELLEGKISRQDVLMEHVKLWEYTGKGVI